MNGLQKIQQGHLRLGFAAYSEDHNEKDDLEMIMEEDSFSSSFDGSNPSSSLSSSSSDSLDDDDASSPVSSQSDEALFNLSELMSHLPIKRGLSKFYQGKSQSFTSLARVTSLEDLAKKVDDHGGYSRRLKACRSYGGELNLSSKQRSSRVIIKSPKSTIAKKSSSSSCFKGKIKNANSFGKPPLSHVQI